MQRVGTLVYGVGVDEPTWIPPPPPPPPGDTTAINNMHICNQ